MTASTISADSHICEIPDLFTGRVDRALRDQVPYCAHDDKLGDAWHFPNGLVTSLAAFASAGTWQGKTTSEMSFAEVPRGAWDPVARLHEMETDGVVAEVLYPSYAMQIFSTIKEASVQMACARAYNDWLHAYCSAAPDRLKGVGILPAVDLDAAIAELRRIAKLGYMNVLIDAHPPASRYYDDSRWEPLWAELEAQGVMVSFHLFAGTAPVFDSEGGAGRMKHFLADYTVAPALLERQLAMLIFAGVTERHPGLRFLCVESDCGWVAHFLKRMDHVYLRKGPRYQRAIKSDLLPSDFFKRQVKCVFQDDRPGILTLEATGSDVLMWGSDYPHNDSTFPDSQRVIAEMFRGVPAADRDKIIYGNAAQLYHLG
ncbi:MAG: amidohydrolase family protein [Candidatus Binataceae bacterium]